jgi:DNA-binding transcriptional MerR regulator
MPDKDASAARRSITSEGLSTRAIRACWVVGVALLIAGITATFVAGTGAAPAAMVLLGSLFLLLALMKRVPLSLEVGGAKIDATYEVDQAFAAGREAGLQQGVAVALKEVEQAEMSGEPPHAALERRRDSWQAPVDLDDGSPGAAAEEGVIGFRGPIACAAAGITYRQLDYWARTGLVTPSGRGRSGAQSLYTERDIVLLKTIKRLLDAGISLTQIRTALHHLRGKSLDELQTITLMSDGDAVYEAKSPDEVIDLLADGRGIFGIALGSVIREVKDALHELPRAH